MLVTNTDISSDCDRKKIAPPVRITATKPSTSGSAAAATEPKIASSTISTIGNPLVSAFWRSDLETSCIAAQSACCPTTCTGTAACAWPSTSRFLRRSTAASIALSALPLITSGINTVSCLTDAFAYAIDCGVSETLLTCRIPVAARSIAATRSLLLCCSLSKTITSDWECTLGNWLSASAAASEPEPGTSKPPAVRCSVWWAANGSAATSSTIQRPRTTRRLRATSRISRSIARCIGQYIPHRGAQGKSAVP